MTTVKTTTVRRQLIGDARKTLRNAAGDNGVVSKAEEKKLPKDLQAAVKTARKDAARVTVDAAVDAYASHVSRALKAVDGGVKGTLSAAEAQKIPDPALRSRVVDVRAQLAGGTSGTGGTAGPVNRGALDRALEDVQTQWGDENIMDGMVAVQSTVVAGGNARDTALRDLQGLVDNGDIDGLVGRARVDGPRALKNADIKALARQVNDDGFQYANQDEVGRIQAQVEGLLRKLGGPAGLEVAVVKQNARYGTISDTDTFPTAVWVVRNPSTNDALSFAVRKGSL